MLVLDSVTKRFSRRQPAVVDDASLHVERGELICVLGESGGGKSTLLRLVGGFEVPDSGTITLNTRTLNDRSTCVPPEQRGISMIFQNHSLFPHMNVQDNIAYGLHKCTASERKASIRRMLALTGLPGLEKRYPHELSGGQQQRVAIARALAPGPSVLLLDEPFSSLDRSLALQIREEIAGMIHESGTTALWVTHHTGDAMAISDRIAVLHEGRLVQVATPQDLYHRPATRYIANLAGRTNFLHLDHSGPVPTCPALQLPVPAATTQHRALAVRPEALFLTDAADAPRGTVQHVAFQGAYHEVTVGVGKEALILQHRGAPPALADTVALALEADACWPVP